jgi:glutathione transport system substrate-binding protein
MPSRRIVSTLVPFALALIALAANGCAPAATPRVTFTWAVGQSEPRFDPGGPPDPVRWAVERLLDQGLVSEDSTGTIVPGVARAWDVRPDSLVYTFHLRPDLRFDDGTPCTSRDVRRALEAGLNRIDHSGYAWLLSPIVGVDHVRAGRPLPPLGIATPDDHTLVLRLARTDPALLRRLATPGASAPWPSGASTWRGGTGPYRLVAHEPGRRMLLARVAGAAGPDTVRVEFAVNAARARTLMRRGQIDLLWPVPAGLLNEPAPAGFDIRREDPRPARRLWLVMRGDLPPTTRSEARRALAHGLNRPDLIAALQNRGASEVGAWPPGGRALDLPAHDDAQVRDWLDRGKLGRSMHVVMAYPAEDPAVVEVARPLQNEWARAALDVELRPLRGQAFGAAALGAGGAQLLLVEAQAWLDDPAAELAMVVEPRRAPPVGGFHTGWRTRDFDRWIGPQPPETPVDLELAAQRLEEDLVAIPVARLPWMWIERTGGARVRPTARYGPGPSVSVQEEDTVHGSH